MKASKLGPDITTNREYDLSMRPWSVASRDLRTTNRLAMRTCLDEVDLGRLVGCKESCDEKTLALETIIKTGLDFVLPLKSKTIIANEPPWISKQLACVAGV